MPLTRQQKEDIVHNTADQLKNSEGVVFTDFTGVGVENLRVLRRALAELGATYQVTKRTLARIALKQLDIDASNKLAETSLGLVFFPSDLPGTAKVLYNYGKEEKNFKILNAYSLGEKRWIESDEVTMLGALPSREELLGQLVFMLQAPIKKLAMVIDQIAKQKA